MSREPNTPSDSETDLTTEAHEASRAIPPLFPLACSVAVNPFLGQQNEPLDVTIARYARIAGTRIVPKRDVWAKKYESGDITKKDIANALKRLTENPYQLSIDSVTEALNIPPEAPHALPTIADLASDVSGIAWPDIIEDRIGQWAASHFDQGQALWQPSRSEGAYIRWRSFATRDLTPEIHGLTGFGSFVEQTSRSHWRALGRSSDVLSLTPQTAMSVFHRLFISLGGWAQYARYLLWQSELLGHHDSTTTELLAIRIVWEEALFHLYHNELADYWTDVLSMHANPLHSTKDNKIDAVFQMASEYSEQRNLGKILTGATPRNIDERPILQAAFCIDVRSEVFRRALESLDTRIETMGFAGFFGLATAHRTAGSDIVEARGPALMKTAVTSTTQESATDDLSRRYAARAKRAWGRFKLAAVSSFAYVEATGPIYAAKLIQDGMKTRTITSDFDPVPRFDPTVDLAHRVQMAKGILEAMSLTSNFGHIVMLAGHGASVTNNPHESSLHCGACGGYAGDVNARLLVGLLNDTEVRTGLAENGITVPTDTKFIAALHDTTTDQMTIFDHDHTALFSSTELNQLKHWLTEAGRLARTERATHLPRATQENDVIRRANDWAELRPEWGLAGCRAFIAAPRSRTDGATLDGQCFLHSYDWKADDGFSVLELILTAPVVVASWISLQYYGSTVAPDIFGGGNKLLHNVTGGIGVLEGNGGNLKPGLPLQSVHDGENFYHDALRLTVIIEAPRSAITDILQRHPDIRALFDNSWLHLIIMNDEGQLAWRYIGDLKWTSFEVS